MRPGIPIKWAGKPKKQNANDRDEKNRLRLDIIVLYINGGHRKWLRNLLRFRQ